MRRFVILLTFICGVVPSLVLAIVISTTIPFVAWSLFATELTRETVLTLVTVVGALIGVVGLMRASVWLSDLYTATGLSVGILTMIWAFPIFSGSETDRLRSLAEDPSPAIAVIIYCLFLGPLVCGVGHLLRIAGTKFVALRNE